MNLYQIAQQVTDEVLGRGAYKRLNHFDPSKDETYAATRGPQTKTRKPKARTLDQLIGNINPKTKLPRGFGLWSEKMQILWLKQNQKKVK